LQHLAVEVHLLPLCQHPRLPGREPRPHGEVGLGEIDGLIVIHCLFPPRSWMVFLYWCCRPSGGEGFSLSEPVGPAGPTPRGGEFRPPGRVTFSTPKKSPKRRRGHPGPRFFVLTGLYQTWG